MTTYARGRSLLRGAALEQAERESQRAYRRARSDARRAEQFYKQAASQRMHAAWLTRRPDLWDEGVFDSPDEFEQAAVTWTRIADHFLQSSFRQTARARERAARARYFREMEASR